jgi:hypothetical protein
MKLLVIAIHKNMEAQSFLQSLTVSFGPAVRSLDLLLLILMPCQSGTRFEATVKWQLPMVFGI